MGGFFSSEIDFSWTQNAWIWNSCQTSHECTNKGNPLKKFFSPLLKMVMIKSFLVSFDRLRSKKWQISPDIHYQKWPFQVFQCNPYFWHFSPKSQSITFSRGPQNPFLKHFYDSCIWIIDPLLVLHVNKSLLKVKNKQ